MQRTVPAMTNTPRALEASARKPVCDKFEEPAPLPTAAGTCNTLRQRCVCNQIDGARAVASNKQSCCLKQSVAINITFEPCKHDLQIVFLWCPDGTHFNSFANGIQFFICFRLLKNITRASRIVEFDIVRRLAGTNLTGHALVLIDPKLP